MYNYTCTGYYIQQYKGKDVPLKTVLYVYSCSNFAHLFSGILILIFSLYSLQLVESETVATNTKARCEGQGTPYFRLSPKLAENVATGETDNRILINMLLATIVQTVPRMEDIHQQFLRIAEANQKERFKMRRVL